MASQHGNAGQASRAITLHSSFVILKDGPGNAIAMSNSLILLHGIPWLERDFFRGIVDLLVI